MNISKISRSLVVVIFVASVVFLGTLDFKLLVGKSQVESNYSNFIKLGYGILILVLSLIYTYIKDKLYKKKVKRKIGLVYRYIYVSIVLVASKFLVLYLQKLSFSNKELVSYIIVFYITGIVIKKIIFNVSKSDILSIFATFAYALLPFYTKCVNSIIYSSLYTCVFLGCVLALQILIDELKQRGVKTKKYIIESLVLGILVGLSLAFGINPLVWFIFALFSIFVSSNLDTTHISFPRKVTSNINQNKREFLYKIERINISKLVISIFIVFVISFAVFFCTKMIVNLNLESNSNNYYLNNITSNFYSWKQININNDFSYDSISSFYTSFASYSKTYYMILIIYIVFMEILAFALKRRYDTKSTMMKLLFVLLINSIFIFDLNLEFYQPMFNILLILIAIVNTSNIYLNREERIKMLVA